MLTGSIRAAMTAAVFLMLLSVPVAAQSDRGTLTGTVQDGSGAVIPEAKVTLTNTQTGVSFNVPTNSAGDYTVPQLQPGIYNIRVEREGFRPATVTGVVLNASATVRADATLEVGAAAQAIEVSASALRSPRRTPRPASRWITSSWTSFRWSWAARCAARSTWRR